MKRNVRKTIAVLTLGLCTTGCTGPRVVFVPLAGAFTRVGPGITGKIYVWDATLQKWILSDGPANYPEGAYLVIRRDATTLP